MDKPRTQKLTNRSRQRLLVGAAIVGMASVAVFSYSKLETGVPRINSATILTDAVRAGEFVREVRGPGTLVADEIRVLAAASSGRVERVIMRPGAQVTADEIIIELSSPELLEALDKALWEADDEAAELRALEARLETERLNLKSALITLETEYNNALAQVKAERPLAEKGIVSALQMEQSVAKLEGLKQRREVESARLAQFERSIQTQVATQTARVEYVGTALQRRQDQVAALNVRAGIDGILQQVTVKEGEQVAIGDGLARIANPDALIAELEIAETQATDVSRGQSVRVDTRNGVVAGEVFRINPAVENGSVQVDVRFTEPLPTGARLDLSVDGTIEIERDSDALFLGRPSSLQIGSNLDLFVLDANGEFAQRKNVRVGRRSANEIEILSGLTPGQVVILSDTSQFGDYERIKVY